MKIGDTIDLNVDGFEVIRSKVIDVNKEFLSVSYPLELRNVDHNTHTCCSVYYIKDNIPHFFETTIEKLINNNIPTLMLKQPERESIKKIQRREYVRIQTNVDVAIYFPNTTTEPVVTVSQDISGGGLRAVLPEEIELKEKQPLDLFFVLTSRKNHYQYMYSKAEFIRSHLENGVRSASIKFLLDDERERQKIISFCFDIQRENRKQGLV